MSTRKVLVLAGGTVALLGAVRARRSGFRRAGRAGVRSPAPARLRLVPAVVLLDWGFPNVSIDLSWVFFGLGSLVANTFGWVLDLVRTAVTGAVNALADFTRSALNLGSQIVDNVIHNVGVLTSSVDDLAKGAWELGKTITTLVPETFRAALDGVETIIWRLLQEWLPDVLRAVGAAGVDLVRTALGGLWDALEWLGSVFGFLRDHFNDLVRLLTSPVESVWDLLRDHVLAFAADIVRAGLDLLWAGLSDLFDFVVKWLDLIVRLITDPIGTLDAFGDALIARTLPVIREQIVEAVSEQGPVFDRYITNALGLN